MANYGIKIAKSGKNVDSSTIDDYIFWSKYPPLTLLEVKTGTITIPTNACSETETFFYSYNFFPLVVGFITGSSNGVRYRMPAGHFESVGCDLGYESNCYAYYEILDGQVDVTFTADCYEPFQGGDSYCPGDLSANIELFFFMWELGSTWPLS